MPEPDDREKVRSAASRARHPPTAIHAQPPRRKTARIALNTAVAGARRLGATRPLSLTHARALAPSQVRAQLKARLQSQDSVFEPQGAPPPLYKPELIEPKKKLTILQHCYKEPWIPIGALTTVSVLCVGFGAFVSGNKKLAQNMMRARVAAQGMTILSMFTATYFIATKPAEAHAEAAR